MIVIKRNKEQEEFNPKKIKSAIYKAFCSMGLAMPEGIVNKVLDRLNIGDTIGVEEIQNIIETTLMKEGYFDVAKSFILYREKHRELRSTIEKDKFIQSYIKAENASTGSKYDSNANVTVKNIATLNAELPKLDSIKLNRYRVCKKLEELYGKNVAKGYLKDLEVNKYIYKHDETCSAIYPYCVAVNMYPFLLNGLKDLGGLSAAPKNIDSFCGMFVNLVFAISSQFMGAVAFGEFFNIFDYFARKEWGDNYYKYIDKPAKIRYIDEGSIDRMLKSDTISIEKQIEQYFQQIVYSINQPAAARGFQSAFVNFNYFDSNYWKAMFGEFVFPDGTKPQWESISWLQKKFMKWFNEERTKCILAFPVESMALLSDSKDIIDADYKEFTAKMYAKGHSFFTYISDNADSLSSCCRLRNEVSNNEFSFTNGLTGVATGSKSVITLNLNRIIQDYFGPYSQKEVVEKNLWADNIVREQFTIFLKSILKRVYKYHIAYNELLKDLLKAKLLPVYDAGFISLKQQFLTIGINGLNEAAEFLGIPISDNPNYEMFCNIILSTISEQNKKHNTKDLKFNTEFVPAESLGVKNAKWDKEDGYVVPRDCYNSYFYLPEDDKISVLEKFRLHGRRYTSNLDGGVGLHCNLDEHLSTEQYTSLIEYAVQEGTSYFTFNIPNTICNDCGYIDKRYLKANPVCPKCGSKNLDYATRIIGYLKRITNFSKSRQEEAKKRAYLKYNQIYE